jgi:hypothetical protein
MPKSRYPRASRPKARFAGLATILWSLLVVMGCVAAPSVSASSEASSSSSSESAVVVHDEAAISASHDDCKAFVPTGRCSFGVVVRTPNGSGGSLYAFRLTAVTGDDCDRGLVYFFDGERLLASTSDLAPHSNAGVVRLRADGPRRFAVGFAVSPSNSTSCAHNGSAGTATYVYGWNGSRVSVVSGSLPSRPKVIVGTTT